jgi:ABC-2 type transport system permease protein
MKKYLHVVNIGFQNNLQYRTNYLARTLFGFIPLFAMLSLWRSIYEGDSTLGERNGFTEAQMIFYYLLVAVVDLFAAVNDDDWQIAADIREGNINHFLLKPMDYLGYRLCLFFSGRLAYISMACIPLGIFIFCFREHFVGPVDSTAMVVFPVAVLMTALLQFFISYTMAMLAFWFLEISTFIFIVFAFEYIASGHLFPLDLLPPVVKQILFFTPFPYELYFPVSVYMGKVTGAALWQGLLIQLFWVLLAFVTARFMWARGVRKYSAFGG